MRGSDKISLDQIEAGDYVAYRESGGWHHNPLSLEKVDSTTRTQIIIGGKRFDRATGSERTSFSRKDSIFPLAAQEDRRLGSGNSRGTYSDVIRIEQTEYAEEKRKFMFAKFISNKSTSSLVREFDAAILEQVAKLLGYVDEAPPVAEPAKE